MVEKKKKVVKKVEKKVEKSCQHVMKIVSDKRKEATGDKVAILKCQKCGVEEILS